MSVTRPIVFWIAMLAAVIAVVALLREVLLPFVAGMVLAYLLDPVANRIERLGMNRLVATLVIIVVVITAIALLIALIVPIIVSELAYFIESFPQYLRRLQSLTTDPTRPWLSKIVGEGLNEAERSLGALTTLASSWVATFLRSIWSGGRALLSIFSLAVVTPIVAFYLVYDWNRMIAVIDNWVPPARRDTVRALAREVDDTISGFVRSERALSGPRRILCDRAVADRSQARCGDWLCSGLSKLHSLSRLALRSRYFDVRRDRAILAGLDIDLARARHILCRAVFGGLCAGTLFGWSPRAFKSGMGNVRAVRLRLSVRLRGPFDRSSACCRHRRAYTLRSATVLFQPAICCCHRSDRAAARDGCISIYFRLVP